MPLNFPIDPINGQTYSYGDNIWNWNGYAWSKSGITFTGGGGSQYLDDLLDVTIAGVTNNDLLIYDDSTSQWKNNSNLDGGVY